MENQDTIRLLRECDAGSKMGTSAIDEVLEQLPADWANKDIKEQRDFFGSWIIELEKEN